MGDRRRSREVDERWKEVEGRWEEDRVELMGAQASAWGSRELEVGACHLCLLTLSLAGGGAADGGHALAIGGRSGQLQLSCKRARGGARSRLGGQPAPARRVHAPLAAVALRGKDGVAERAAGDAVPASDARVAYQPVGAVRPVGAVGAHEEQMEGTH